MHTTVTDIPLLPLSLSASPLAPPVYFYPPKHHGWPGPSQKKRRLWKRRQGGKRR